MQLKKNHTSPRIVGLDLLRSIAILLVVYQHSLMLTSSPEFFYKFNLDGVSIFFVLSGFLIGKILINTLINQNLYSNLIRFYVFRITKTIPSYFFILILILFYYLFTSQNIDEFSFKYFIFIQNFYSIHPDFFKEAWSLCVEEWFYFLVPIFLLFVSIFLKNKKQVFLMVCLFFVLFSTVLRIFYYSQNENILVNEVLRKIVLLRFDTIIYGFIGAFLYSYYPLIWKKYTTKTFIIGIILLLLLELKSNIYPPFYFSFEAITILCFLPFLNKCVVFKPSILNNTFIFISKISYSLYLINLTFMHIVFIPFFKKYVHFLIVEEWSLLFYYLFFTFVFAAILNYTIEKPFLRIRNFFNN